MLKELTIDQFTQTLASDSPVPGGGSAAALAGATAASLIAMVASLTIGKVGCEDNWDEMSNIKGEMEKCRTFFLEAMDKDAGSYAKVIECFKLPKGTEEEKACRAVAVQEALYQAALIPLEVAEKAASLFPYAATVMEKGNKNAASDGAVAALMARTCAKGALYNVLINAISLKDEGKRNDLQNKARQLETKVEATEAETLKLLKF